MASAITAIKNILGVKHTIVTDMSFLTDLSGVNYFQIHVNHECHCPMITAKKYQRVKVLHDRGVQENTVTDVLSKSDDRGDHC